MLQAQYQTYQVHLQYLWRDTEYAIQFSLNDEIDRFAIDFVKGTRLPACSDLDFTV
jgi:hypothetical protein